MTDVHKRNGGRLLTVGDVRRFAELCATEGVTDTTIVSVRRFQRRRVPQRRGRFVALTEVSAFSHDLAEPEPAPCGITEHAIGVNCQVTGKHDEHRAVIPAYPESSMAHYPITVSWPRDA